MTPRFIRALFACLVGVGYGGYLIWKGVTGDIWRSGFTGDAVVPRWLYIVGGVLLILIGLGWMAVTLWIAGM